MISINPFVRDRFGFGTGLFWSFIVVWLVGCAPETVKLSQSAQSSLKSILIVAVEPPPLEVLPDLIESRMPVYRHFDNMVLPFAPEVGLYRNQGGILIAGQIGQGDSVTEVSFSEEPGIKGKIKNTHPVSSVESVWTPTHELSSAAVSQLHANGIKASTDRQVHRLPWATAERSANLAGWHNAVERWYGNEKVEFDYRRLGAEHFDAVLELGIGRYKIFEGQVSLEVLIKLIDPSTGQVIARSSATTRSFEDSAQTLLAQDGAKFKELIRKMGMKLLAQEFHDIGLIRANWPAPFLPTVS